MIYALWKHDSFFRRNLMNVIKSLGARFNKLWRWIKETAWVQPLLIVGAIFAIIFSIPKFSTWFEAMGIGSSESYFTNYKLSLEGEKKEADETAYTRADKITQAIYENSFAYPEAPGSVNFANSEYAKKLAASGVKETYGEKFFLVYVESSSTACSDAQAGFETLTKGWNTTYGINDGRSFKIHTIYADETSSNDEDYTVTEDQKAFNRYLNNFTDFWEKAAGRLEDTPYKTNGSISDSYYENIEKVNVGEWQIPTILLIDFSEEAWVAGRAGISEAAFSVTGASSIEKAQFLQKMWNHVPMVEWNAEESTYKNVASTEDKSNIFRAEFQKN